MKTENLSWAEAMKAYVEGHTIRHTYSGPADEYKLVDGQPMWRDENDKWAPHTGRYLHPDQAPFSIVKPEVKSLTYEEACEASRVNVHLPDGKVKTFGFEGSEKWNWTIEAMCFFDLAERKGYLMTEVPQ